MYQIVITIWLSSTPFAYTLPELYPSTTEKCAHRAKVIYKHKKPGIRMDVSCVELPEGFRFVTSKP